MSAAATRRSEAVVSLRDVCLHYAGGRRLLRRARRQVLRDFNLDIGAGQTLGIIGRNGAGKSSLLRLLAGVVAPDSGAVLRHRPRMRVSLLTLALGFNPYLTGRENAILGCMLAGLSRAEAAGLLGRIVEFSGLGGMIDAPLASYSSGMRARLGFSVAYFTQADMMLIDEVLGVGDHEFRRKSREAIYRAIRSERTVVLVSHDEYTLADLCDSLVWIEGGRNVMQGPVGTVLETYHDFDYLVNELARKFGKSAEEVRGQPEFANPARLLGQFRSHLRAQRDAALDGANSGADSAVRQFYPGHRHTHSHLLDEECGRTVWVEGFHEVAGGEGHEVRGLYRHYEELLLNVARLSKTRLYDARKTLLSKQMLGALHRVARLNQRA